MAACSLVHLAGLSRGVTWWLAGDVVRIVSDGRALVPFAARPREIDGEVLAELIREGEGYRLREISLPLWVNGVRARDHRLQPGDLIEIGERQAVLRYRETASLRAGRAYKRVRDSLSDCVDCARYGGRGVLHRLGLLLLGPPYELATQVAPAARFAMLAAVVVLVGSIAGLWYRNVLLERQIAAQTERIEGLSQLLARSEQQAFSQQDFQSVRQELDFRIDETLSRLQALENRAGARAKTISAASNKVLFVQGAYGFVEPGSGRQLRQVEGASAGALTIGGNGTVLAVRYTGTAFVVGDDGMVLTNRHVATPWEFDDTARQVIQRGFAPRMIRFVGYLPGRDEALPLHMVRAHPDADVALLRCDAPIGQLHGLTLSDRPPEIGEEVVVLGYPTGMRALLARAEPDFVKHIMDSGPIDFWQLAQQLSHGGYIAPLATVGVIGQITHASVVYDAETTHGGSGGPVLDLDGTVLAVNAAIVPEFGGSNLGVPAARALELLAASADRQP